MKQLIGHDVGGYAFDPANQSITLTGLPLLAREQILLITNTTLGQIIYSFADPSLGGDLSSNTLTLAADCAGMDASDALQIYIDLPEVVQPISAAALPLPTGAAEEETLAALREMTNTLETLTRLLAQSPINRTRVNASSDLAVTAGISGQASAGNSGAITSGAPSVGTTTWLPVWVGPVDQRFEMAQRSNIEYSEAQRSRFTF